MRKVSHNTGSTEPEINNLTLCNSIPKPTGIINLGNLCYMNVVIQCLVRTPDIGHCRHSSKVVKQWCLLRNKMLLSDFPVDVSEFKKELDETKKFEKEGCQDSVSFLTVLLDMLICESSLFKGKYRSRLKCSICHHHNDTFTTFTSINLPITGHDLITLYNNFTKIEQDVNYKCEKCEVNTKHSKKISVHEFPDRLIISFNRFTSDMKKIKDIIYFPTEQLSLEKYTFKLYGIIEFLGDRIEGGDYIATIRANNEWKKYNDSVVSDREFNHHDYGESAYVLFYQKF